MDNKTISLEIGNWEHWLQRVEEYIYPSDSVPEFSSILVPNVDNVRSNFLIDTIAKQHKVTLVITGSLVRGTLVINPLIWESYFANETGHRNCTFSYQKAVVNSFCQHQYQ